MTTEHSAGSRRQSAALTVLGRLIPGVARVHAQVLPFADAWRAANAAELRRDGPLWVALGDSMSQGIGAQSIDGGWVGQLHSLMKAAGRDMRLVNLSATGARVSDVLSGQLPQIADLGITPDLITILVGANDMIVPRRRAAAVPAFASLIAELPAVPTVISPLPRHNPQATAINALIDAAAAAGRLRVTQMRSGPLRSLRGTLSEDHFHPNERGYATIAAAFAAVLGLATPPR